MKKFVSLLLVFVLSVSCMIGAMPVSAAEDDTTVPLGDVNIDGNVDVIDATLLQRYCVNMSGVFVSFFSADVDDDGYITIIDVTLIQRYLAGLHTPYSVGIQPIVIDRDNNDDSYHSAERFGRVMLPLFGNGTASLNNVLLTKDDALRFRETAVSDNSVTWFLEKYHLIEDDGWTVDSLTNIDNGIRLQLSFDGSDGTYTAVEQCDYELDIICDDESFLVESDTRLCIYACQSAFMNDFSAPLVFNDSRSVFGDDSVISFDMDSYRGFSDAFGFDISDFDNIETRCEQGRGSEICQHTYVDYIGKDDGQKDESLDCFKNYDVANGSCILDYFRHDCSHMHDILYCSGHLHGYEFADENNVPSEDCSREIGVSKTGNASPIDVHENSKFEIFF